MEEKLPLQDKVLLLLHSLGAVKPEKAMKLKELANLASLHEKEMEKVLNENESQGYAKSFIDNKGFKRYYLSGTGILRACSIYT